MCNGAEKLNERKCKANLEQDTIEMFTYLHQYYAVHN